MRAQYFANHHMYICINRINLSTYADLAVNLKNSLEYENSFERRCVLGDSLFSMRFL